jgi:hypothetical protein
MHGSIALVLALVLAAAGPVRGAVKMGALTPWYVNQLTLEQGATISSPAEPMPGYDLRTLIDPGRVPPPAGGERFVFADRRQHEVFTVDFGRVWEDGVCMIRVHPGDGVVYGNPGGRKPERLKVEASADGLTWAVLRDWPAGQVPIHHSIIWDRRPVRYLRIDLGENSDGMGSRMGRILLFPRYHRPPLADRLAELAGLLRSDVAGLEPFRAALGRGDLPGAVGALRAHFAKAPVTLLDAREIHAQRADDWEKGIYRYEERSWQLPAGVHDWYYYPFDLSNEPPSYWVAGQQFWYLPDWCAGHPEPRYAGLAARMIGSWLTDVPCPGVHNFGRDGETGMPLGWPAIRTADRLGSLCRACFVFAPEREHFDDETWVNLLYAIHEHARYQAHFIPSLGGNWLTWANDRLIRTANEYSEFKDSRGWLEVGRSAFEKVVLNEVSSDGKETEDSTYYCLRAMSEIIRSYEAFVKAGVPLDPKVVARVKRALDFPAWAYLPDGRNPGIGDIGTVDVPHDHIPLLERYAAGWGRDDLVWINTRGREGRRPEPASRAFLEDGFFVMRSGWEDGLDARHLIFHCPPAHHIGHGHRDVLSVLLYGWGRPLLIDPGMTIYGKEGSEHYRTTGMHNTIAVEGASQAYGPGGRPVAWESRADHDYAEGWHDLFKGTRHRRRVIFVKPDYYVLIDEVSGEGSRRLEWNYHFLAGADPAESDGVVRTRFPEGGNLAIAPLDAGSLVRGEPKPFKYVQSSAEIDSIGWVLRREGPLPCRLITLLVPFKGTTLPPIQGRLQGDNAVEVRVGSRRDLLRWPAGVDRGPATGPARVPDRDPEPAVTVTPVAGS